MRHLNTEAAKAMKYGGMTEDSAGDGDHQSGEAAGHR